MKKYTSRATKWLIVVSLICGVVLLTGIILFYTLSLTNGRKITLTLYHYGKEAEIWETIKSSIV